MKQFTRFAMLMLAVSLAVAASAEDTTLAGTITNGAATVLVNGSVVFTLKNCAGSPVTGSITYTMTLDGSGVIGTIAPITMTSNAGNGCPIIALGSSSYYEVKAKDSTGQVQWTRPYTVTSPTFNLQTATALASLPTPSNSSTPTVNGNPATYSGSTSELSTVGSPFAPSSIVRTDASANLITGPLVSGDIPSNAANTSGTAAGLSATLDVAHGGTGLVTAPANCIFAGPTSGGSAAPSCRSAVLADIPISISGNTTKLASVNGTPLTGNCPAWDANGNLTAGAACGGGGTVSGVSNADGSLIISPTTGAIVASIAPTTVVAGSYTALNATINADGQVTSATSGVSGAGTQRGGNVTLDFGANNMSTGASDNGFKLATIVNGLASTGKELWIPCGTYNFTSTANITKSTNVSIVGEAKPGHNGAPDGCVIFSINFAGRGIWFNHTGTSQDVRGPYVRNIEMVDGTGGGGVGHTAISGITLTQIDNAHFENVSFNAFGGYTYNPGGTVTVTNGSHSLTGVGFPALLQTYGGILYIAGYPYEISSNPIAQGLGTPSSTQLFLESAYPAARTAGAQAFIIHYGGKGLEIDPGTGSASDFSQYGSFYNMNAWETLYPEFLDGGNTAQYGVSRYKFRDGFLNCNSLADSIAVFSGGYDDTGEYDQSENNCTFGMVLENSPANVVFGFNFENSSGGPPANTTCPGSPSVACTKGVLIQGDDTAHNNANRVLFAHFNQIGNAVELGQTVTKAQLVGNRYITVSNSRVLPAAGNAGYDTTVVLDPDVIQLPATSGVTIGGATQKAGSGAPSGACSNGSTYHRTDSGVHPTLYNCENSAWVAK